MQDGGSRAAQVPGESNISGSGRVLECLGIERRPRGAGGFNWKGRLLILRLERAVVLHVPERMGAWEAARRCGPWLSTCCALGGCPLPVARLLVDGGCYRDVTCAAGRAGARCFLQRWGHNQNEISWSASTSCRLWLEGEGGSGGSGLPWAAVAFLTRERSHRCAPSSFPSLRSTIERIRGRPTWPFAIVIRVAVLGWERRPGVVMRPR